MADIKLGVLCWNQYADWQSLLEAGIRVDELGYHSLWTWDHLYPIVGDHTGPMFEGWLTLAAWAQATKNVRIGLMVGANTFREPPLVAKMATTLDHISNGRAVLGIGAAWFATEHRAFGLQFGDGPPERLRWLAEALPVMRGMLAGERPSAAGPRYHAREVINNPPPVQQRLPILIGGGGERVTLRLVARYADGNNVGGGIENVRRKDRILRQHCEAVGRDEREIERTAGIGRVVIRDSREEARRVGAAQLDRNGGARSGSERAVGTPEDLVELLAPYPEIGYHHLIVDLAAPYDEETLVRLAREVAPKLAGLA